MLRKKKNTITLEHKRCSGSYTWSVELILQSAVVDSEATYHKFAMINGYLNSLTV